MSSNWNQSNYTANSAFKAPFSQLGSNKNLLQQSQHRQFVKRQVIGFGSDDSESIMTVITAKSNKSKKKKAVVQFSEEIISNDKI